jgi:hypothetical protein
MWTEPQLGSNYKHLQAPRHVFKPMFEPIAVDAAACTLQALKLAQVAYSSGNSGLYMLNSSFQQHTRGWDDPDAGLRNGSGGSEQDLNTELCGKKRLSNL